MWVSGKGAPSEGTMVGRGIPKLSLFRASQTLEQPSTEAPVPSSIQTGTNSLHAKDLKVAAPQQTALEKASLTFMQDFWPPLCAPALPLKAAGKLHLVQNAAGVSFLIYCAGYFKTSCERSLLQGTSAQQIQLISMLWKGCESQSRSRGA